MTGRLVVVHEAPRTCGLGAEIVSLVCERAFYHLEAAPVRVTGFWDIAVPIHARARVLALVPPNRAGDFGSC